MPKTAKPKQIEPYEHHDKDRLNNPPVGLVSPELDPDSETPLRWSLLIPGPGFPERGMSHSLCLDNPLQD
jgi:hypothetical protein